MIDFFDRIYTSFEKDSNLFVKFRFNSVIRLTIRLTINLLAPLYFILTKGDKRFTLEKSMNVEGRIIVSLTSFPTRINRVWLVIETILRQTMKPDLIILWLSKEQFSSFYELPPILLRLRERGVEIRLVEGNIRSHKKYYYAMKEFPYDYIITVDDDVLYSSRLLSHLIELSQKFPLAICCNQAARITLVQGDITPYLSWPCVKLANDPTDEIMPIGLGGILYPPFSLHFDVFNIEIFKKYCFLADDIWLNIMAHLKGTQVAKTAYFSNYIPVLNINNKTLTSINAYEHFNDIQLRSVREYYITNFGIDPYQNINAKINEFKIN